MAEQSKKIALHIRLKQYRVLYVVVTIFFIWLGVNGWLWFEENHKDMSEAAAAGFVSIYASIIGGLKYILENSRQDQDHDDSN